VQTITNVAAVLYNVNTGQVYIYIIYHAVP
jgi:hypothetical protein